MSSEINDQKRPRNESSPGDVISRVCLSRGDFGKVIGKGGQTIANIRGKCGAVIKGTEVTEEKRLLVISGTFVQVVDAFDLVSDILYSNHMHSNPTENFTFHVMIEHAKAGRVVGPKGSNIQALKSRSGATQVRVVKDPEDMNGTQLREILIEGSLQAVRRVHFHILELFYDINLVLLANSGIPIHRGSTLYDMITSHPGSINQTPVFGAPPGFIPGGPVPAGSRGGSVIPLNSLQSLGLHTDVVTRLREMQSYLNQFGLDLHVLDGRPHASVPQLSFPPTEYSPSAEFYIPRETVGGIIGRGGQGLRDLMHETGCKIHIEKNELDGARLVRILTSGSNGNIAEDEGILQFAKEIVLKRVTEIKESQGDDLDG